MAPTGFDAGGASSLSGFAWSWGLGVSFFTPGEGHIRPMLAELRQGIRDLLGLVMLALVVGGCGAGRGHPPPVVLGPEVTPLIQTARSQLGARYHPGGTSPATGFDCSGFTQWVYLQHGISLPRQSFDQYQVGLQVRDGQLQQGDLVFFEIEKKGASHVGIYEARGWFIHCSSSGGRVREDHLAEQYWQKHYLGACRPQPQRAQTLQQDLDWRVEDRLFDYIEAPGTLAAAFEVSHRDPCIHEGRNACFRGI